MRRLQNLILNGILPLSTEHPPTIRRSRLRVNYILYALYASGLYHDQELTKYR